MIITKEVFHDLIQIERNNQIEKWGDQEHSDERWVVILLEELGEVAKAIVEGDEAGVLSESVQVAALLEAWMESRDF